MNDFEKGFLASFLGYWLGSKVDQTRFGIWFSTHPIINTVWFIGKVILSAIATFLIGYFILLVIQQMSI